MKYNPVVDEQLAWLDGFANLHPYQDEADTQGALQLMWELERLLASITGMARMSACSRPRARRASGRGCADPGVSRGARRHGADAGADPRLAHGTNPASAAACGLEVVTIKSNHDGTVDVDDFSATAERHGCRGHDDQPQHARSLRAAHRRDRPACPRRAVRSLYYDGANLNAILGVARPGDMGVDVMHYNLHKTFSSPHGGGGPGAGPIAVA